MRKALKFERRPAAHHEFRGEQRLERYDHALPRQSRRAAFMRKLWRGAAVRTPCDPVQPPMGHILFPQSAGIAVLFQPGGIGYHPLGKGAL